MAVAVQIGTYEELQKIIADSDKEYDRERIEQAKGRFVPVEY